jgi:hypothetical protein
MAGALMPMAAPGESHVQSGVASLSASAHLDFRIIIPEVLYLNTGAADGIAVPIAVFSNGRSVALATTVHGADSVTAHLILNGAGRRGVSRSSACGSAVKPAGAAGSYRLVCTASAP